MESELDPEISHSCSDSYKVCAQIGTEYVRRFVQGQILMPDEPSFKDLDQTLGFTPLAAYFQSVPDLFTHPIGSGGCYSQVLNN